MPKIERYVCIRYQGIVYDLINCCSSDEKARREAIYTLEKRLGKMRGGLMKYFRENPEEIWGSDEMKVSDKYLRDLLREVVSIRANNCCEYPGCKNTECDPHHFFSKNNLSIRYSYESCLNLCCEHHTGPISAHSQPMIFEAVIIYYQVRTIEWLQEVINRKNQIITVAPEIYREEQKEKLLAELKRLGIRGWRK